MLEKLKKTFWEGVRNYQARNFMRDKMKLGDIVLVYHSNADPSGVIGTAEVVELAKPDFTALDPKSDYYDPKASKENPRWCAVTLGKPKKLPRFVSLAEMRGEASLANMLLLQKGQRLSILPILKKEFDGILKLAGRVYDFRSGTAHEKKFF